MFTGIVEETGLVRGIKPGPKSIQFTVEAAAVARGLKIGDSVAINGCCLTVVKITARGRRKVLRFDLLRETWERTNLAVAKVGSSVNLERAMRADGRLDGHFVTGHVEAMGEILRWERIGSDHVLDVAAPPEVMRYVVFKGSVAVDGISLTVAKVGRKSFRLWIIPHTHEVTALRERRVGDAVNLETDLLAKYVEKFMQKSGRRSRKPALRSRH